MKDARPSLFKNIAALYSLQGLQYLIPLISLPWLIHALGTAGYGLLGLAMTFGGYLQLIGDYGFGLSATRKVANVRNDTVALSKLISDIFLAKWILLAGGSLIILATIALVPSFSRHGDILLLGCASSLIGSLQPTWLFQGMERMTRIATLSILTKSLQLGLWMTFVHRTEHLKIALAINLIVSLLGTGATWFMALRTFSVRIQRACWVDALSELRVGLEIFLSIGATTITATSPVILLGLLSSPHELGLFCMSEKIARAAISLGSPVGTALFPRVGGMFAVSPRQAIAYLRGITPRFSLLFLGISVGLASFPALAARLANVPETDVAEVAFLLRILSALPLTIFLDNIFGTQILLNMDRRDSFLIGVLASCLIGLAIQSLLLAPFGARGAAISLLAAGLWNLGYFAWQSNKVTGFPGDMLSANSKLEK